MRRKLINFLAWLGALALISAIAAALAVMAIARKGRVADNTILELDLERNLVEYVPESPLGQVMYKDAPTLRDVVFALERAAADPHVVALIARVGNNSLGLAKIQELRDAVMAFRRSGKPAVAQAETFGEFGPGNGSYYLATAFSEIYLQPSGDVGLTGLVAETPFVKGTLEKLGVVPRLDHRAEYKSFMNTFTEKKYTAPHRESLKRIIDSQFAQIVRGISETRHLTEDEVRKLADQGPLSAAQAAQAKLVDGLNYRDEVYAKLKGQMGEHAQLLYAHKYLERAGSPYKKGTRVALIYGVGGVSRGPSEFDALSRSFSMGSDTVSAAFRAAIDDPEVKAILFRVDSPGGSYVASDTIWRETVRARKAGKPVIVSMGDVAGSGGYFVAMAAEKIVAEPGTITGSIGVLGGKMVTGELWDKLGISWDEVHTSSNGDIWTGTHDYSPGGWQHVEAWLDHVYTDFTGKAADGRKLPKDKLLAMAKGRIWTGEDAKSLGLVDELGGYATALKLVREAAKLAPDAPLELKQFPEAKPPLRALLEKGPDNSEKGAAETIGVALPAPLSRAARAIGLETDPQVLSMPPMTKSVDGD
jgi:protease-4